MKECLLCKKDMKAAKTLFGNGCIKNIYKLLNLDMPKKVKDMEQHLCKYIMKQVNITKLKDYYNDANSIPKSMLSSTLYNIAYFEVKFGLMTVYKIIVRFEINDYEVK